MCAPRKEGEPLFAYYLRYSVELVEKHAGGVLAVIGFVMLWWYSEKMERQQEVQQTQFIQLIKEQQAINAQQTAAIQELTFYIKEHKVTK